MHVFLTTKFKRIFRLDKLVTIMVLQTEGIRHLKPLTHLLHFSFLRLRKDLPFYVWGIFFNLR